MDGVCQGLQAGTQHRPLCEESLVLFAPQLQTQRPSGSQVCAWSVFLHIFWDRRFVCVSAYMCVCVCISTHQSCTCFLIKAGLLSVVTSGKNRSCTDRVRLALVRFFPPWCFVSLDTMLLLTLYYYSMLVVCRTSFHGPLAKVKEVKEQFWKVAPGCLIIMF